MNTQLIEVELVRVELDIEYARLEVANASYESRAAAFEHLTNASKRLDCVEATIKDAMKKLDNPWYNVSIEELVVSRETMEKLIEANIETVDVLMSYSENDLIRLPNFGRKAINDVKAAMLYRNIFLSGTDNPKLKQSNVRPLSELGLPVRIENCLIHGGGITSIDQLLMQTEEQLLKCPNLGEKSILEIKSIVSSKGLVWAANQVKS